MRKALNKMKLNKDIMLGNIDGKDFAIATGNLSKSFNGIINNNPTANYIFTLLKTEQTEDSIVAAMLKNTMHPRKLFARMCARLSKRSARRVFLRSKREAVALISPCGE